MNLFEDAHGYQDTDWVIGASVLLVLTFRSEQRTEYLLVYIIVFLHFVHYHCKYTKREN